MQMNIFIKQFRRNTLLTTLLVVLLAVGMAFGSIGLAAWVTAWKQLVDMEDNYTTVAIPVGNEEEGNYGGTMYNFENLLYVEGEKTLLTEQKEHEYPGVLAEDMRGFLAARVSGCESVSPYERDCLSSSLFDAYNHSMMVAAVRCISVQDMTNPESLSVKAVCDESGEIIGYEEICRKLYWAEFEPEEMVCRFPGYETIPEDTVITLCSYLYTAEGEIPFVQGRTYLLFGIDQGHTLIDDGFIKAEPDGEIHGRIATDLLSMGGGSTGLRFDGSDIVGNLFFSWEEKEDSEGKRYYTLKEDSLPAYAEYTGDWKAFLESEEGTVWREELIPWCQMNYESVSVILTDNIDSLLLFNNGSAYTLEGRKFQKEEYANGDNVCMVSAAYAAKNNLAVGDTVNLDLYRTDLEYQTEQYYESIWTENIIIAPVWVQNSCVPEDRIGVQKDYTIVGIYTAPEFSAGWHNFQADTIFVPKASVPDAEQYENERKVLMYSVILENGMEGEFDEYISAMGYGGKFVYSNQGYYEAKKSFETLAANALRLAVAGTGVFLLTSVLFLFLIFRRTKTTILNARRLGVSRKTVQKEWLAATAVMTGLAAFAGACLGYVLHGTVTERALKSMIAAQPQMIVLCVAVQAILLLGAAAVCAAVMAHGRLMAGKGKK